MNNVKINVTAIVQSRTKFVYIFFPFSVTLNEGVSVILIIHIMCDDQTLEIARNLLPPFRPSIIPFLNKLTYFFF